MADSRMSSKPVVDGRRSDKQKPVRHGAGMNELTNAVDKVLREMGATEYASDAGHAGLFRLSPYTESDLKPPPLSLAPALRTDGQTSETTTRGSKKWNGTSPIKRCMSLSKPVKSLASVAGQKRM